MTRSRVTVALTAFALLAAGTVLAVSSMSAAPAVPATDSNVAAATNAAVTAPAWNETGRKGTMQNP